MSKMRLVYYLKAVIFMLGIMNTKISYFICMTTYVLFNGYLTAEKAFVVLACYNSVHFTLTIAIPLGLTQMAECETSMKRVMQTLLAEETQSICQESTDLPFIETNDLSVKINDSKILLDGVALSLKAGLHGITGAVGSGKSTLLKVLLNDYPVSEGYFKLKGSVSYASQDPWLFPGTIRQNILFGETYVHQRYQKVLEVCDLTKDLEDMAQGDNTLVIDRGLNLSQGQQARINLARAVYRKTNIYLLDNPLSALDANICRRVFRNCIIEFLKGTLRILVTHQKQFLQESDSVTVLNAGKIEYHGSYVDMNKECMDFEDEFVHPAIKSEVKCNKNANDSNDVDDANENMKLLENLHQNEVKQYQEIKKEGKVDSLVFKKYFQYAGGLKIVIGVLFLGLITQSFTSGFDYFISYW